MRVRADHQRHAAVEAVGERLGGDVGLRSAFAAGDADRRRRLVGLVRDLGGQSEAAAMERLAGQAGPRLAA